MNEKILLLENMKTIKSNCSHYLKNLLLSNYVFALSGSRTDVHIAEQLNYKCIALLSAEGVHKQCMGEISAAACIFVIVWRVCRRTHKQIHTHSYTNTKLHICLNGHTDANANSKIFFLLYTARTGAALQRTITGQAYRPQQHQ